MATTHIDYRKIDYDQLLDKPITRIASGVNPTTAGVYDRGDGNRFIVTVDGQNITQVIEEKDGYQTRSSTDGGTTWTTWDEVEFSKSGDIDAEDVSYDNTVSELTATNVQDAIDEIDTSVDDVKGDITDIQTDITNIQGDITNIQTDITEIKDIVEVETMPSPSEDAEGTIIQYKGATTSTFTHGYFYECVGDGQDPETFSRVNIQVQDNPSQAEVMPTPSAENVGQIIQYAGDTNNYYTHAHFYEVIEDPENPGQYIYKEVEVQDSPAQSEDMPEADEDNIGTIIQYIGETDANFTHGYFYECISDGQDPATYSWVNVKVQDGEQTVYLTQEQYDALPSSKLTDGINYVIYALGDVNPVDGESVQVTVLPTASADIVGAIHQYVGATTANYTNGYFYKCVSDGAVTPTYSREQINVQPAGSGGEGHEVITQAAYDLLTPAQKAEKVYMIKESGTPGTVLTAGAGIDISNNEISADMATAVYDNTTSGLTATTVQGAIDEVNSKSEQIVTLNGDIILPPINQNTDGGRYRLICAATSVYPVLRSNYSSGGQDMCIATTTGSTLRTYNKSGETWKCFGIDDKVFFYNGSSSKVVDLNTLIATTVSYTYGKTDGEYIYVKDGSTYKKYSWDTPTVEESSTAGEYSAIPDGIYYQGYYYSTSSKNIIVKDSTGATVQTIENFGYDETLQIFNGKIYKAVDGVFYAVAKTL